MLVKVYRYFQAYSRPIFSTLLCDRCICRSEEPHFQVVRSSDITTGQQQWRGSAVLCYTRSMDSKIEFFLKELIADRRISNKSSHPYTL
ncbi:hypothetical protein L9F63_003879, partial [Diploptera punctata]